MQDFLFSMDRGQVSESENDIQNAAELLLRQTLRKYPESGHIRFDFLGDDNSLTAQIEIRFKKKSLKTLNRQIDTYQSYLKRLYELRNKITKTDD